jgi:hypothetical protein
VDNELVAHNWQHAPELYDKELYVEYDGVCKTECHALLRSAKHLSDLQEATLKVCLPNKKIMDDVHNCEQSNLEIGDHMIRCYMQEMR